MTAAPKTTRKRKKPKLHGEWCNCGETFPEKLGGPSKGADLGPVGPAVGFARTVTQIA